MNKKLFFSILYVVLIVVVILFMIYMIFWLQTESMSCLRDPLQFYADKIGSSQCYCIDDFLK